MMRAIRTVLALVLLAPAVVIGKVITVDSGGFGDSATIQAAVDQAGDGDTVEIQPGTYTGAGNRDVDVRGRTITIRSVDPNDWAVVDATIIDCCDPQGDPHRAFCLIGQTPDVTLAGLTITHARGINGGGIKCLGFVTVSRCHILNCSAGRGGAIYCSGLWNDESLFCPPDGDGATVRILDCRIEHNAASMGGAIFSSSDGVLVRGCEIRGNRADSNGGGVAGDFTVADLENNTIQGNRAGTEGGAVWLHETAATVSDSWLVGNWAARYGGAVYVRNVSYLGVPQVIVRGATLVGNDTDGEAGGVFLQELDSDDSPGVYGFVSGSILWQNKDSTGSGLAAQIRGPVKAAYSCIQGIDPNESVDSHNLAADPLLVRWPDNGGDGWGDNPDTNGVNEGSNDDFGDPHLQPTSPCIQAGDPAARISVWLSWAADLDGQPREMDGVVEIGVDEFCLQGIVILYPCDGEVLIGGTIQQVVWQSWTSASRLRLEFSADGGEHWEVLDANAPSSGRLAWQVPGTVQSDACLIRVTPTSAQSPSEVVYSDLFSIYPAAVQTEIAAGWRTAGGNFQRTGRSEKAGPTTACLRWRFDAKTAITCAPVVGLNGRIHLATYQGQICTLDADGTLLWACDTHDVIWGSPTVAENGTLYASSEGGWVYQIAPSGLLKRSCHVSPANDSPAILAHDRLALGSGILDLATGEFLRFWAQSPTLTLASPALGSDGCVYAVAWDMPGLYAFDPDSGAQKWSCVSESQGRSFAGPVVGENGMVYQTCIDDSYLYAVDAKTGALAWRTDLADPCAITSDRDLVGVESWSEPVLGPDGTVYACLDDPFVRAIDPATGRIKWVTRLGSDRGFTMAVDSQGYVYAASEDGCLYVVDAQGRQVSTFESDTPLCCPVIAAEGLVLVVGEKGTSLDEAADILYAIKAGPGCSSLVLYPREAQPVGQCSHMSE